MNNNNPRFFVYHPHNPNACIGAKDQVKLTTKKKSKKFDLGNRVCPPSQVKILNGVFNKV
jgi:hypothetical protein